MRFRNTTTEFPANFGAGGFWKLVFHCLLLNPLYFAITYPQASAQTPSISVSIRQLHDVVQGAGGWFEVKIDPKEDRLPVTLRLNCPVGTGAAVFDNGGSELLLKDSRVVQVHGVVGSEYPGAITLSAWREGDSTPSDSVFFDVLAANPEPRIYFDGHDVTGTVQEVIVGQQIQLNVVLHPSLRIHSQFWSIGNPGDYSGGFLHTPLHGGPQPVILEGSTTRFHWLAPAFGRTVTYYLTLLDGTTASASVKFNIDGPSSVQVAIAPVQVVIAPGALPNSAVLGLSGSGITFRAGYFLPEQMLKNFTWVQLIQFDYLSVKTHEGSLGCSPKSLPVAQLGTGLDSSYPYDTRNPTRDNPPLQLTPEAQEFSRTFHARMYLLWSSGLSNSIPIPLGYVDWHFSAHAVLKDAVTNNWVLTYGSGGPDDPVEPFKQSHSYPLWNSLVPYTGVLTCN